MTNANENTQGDFFFWLGADAELISVSKPKFDEKIEDTRKERDDYINVRTSNS